VIHSPGTRAAIAALLSTLLPSRSTRKHQRQWVRGTGPRLSTVRMANVVWAWSTPGMAGVVAGAPIVCLIGASYVTALTGGGPPLRAAVAAGLLLAVLGLALGSGAGIRASTLAQLLLVALLIAVVVTAVAAVAALVLTAGAVNAYLSGAAEMLRELTAVPSHKEPNGAGRLPRFSARALPGVVALAGLVLIGLSALRLADITALVSVPTAMFLCVYLSCTAAAAIAARPAARRPRVPAERRAASLSIIRAG